MSAERQIPKRKAKRVNRVNSEPDALSVLRSKGRMGTSLSESSPGDTDPGTGFMTRIRGLGSDFMKRVSRVMSDEDLRNLRILRQRLAHIDSDTEQGTVDSDTGQSSRAEGDDPNLRQQRAERSLHDVYRQIQLRRITSVDPPNRSALQIPTKSRDPPTKETKETFEIPKTKITEAVGDSTNNADLEVYNALKALQEGKSSNEIPCTRNIVQRLVTLQRSPASNQSREEQGGQFGLRVVGGKRMAGGMLCAFIASITPDSPASKSTDIHEGDLVLRWNDNNLIGKTFEECQDVLENCQDVLENCQTAKIVVSNFLRGSYRRYKPRSTSNSRTGSVESILRGTTHKWITLTRRGVLARQDEREETGPVVDTAVREETGNAAQDAPKTKVEIRILHVAMENRLSVHLIQGCCVPERDGLEGLDMFCKLYLSPESSNENKRRSKTALKTYSPYWNQHMEFQPVMETDLRDKNLTICWFAHHWLHKDQLIGQVDIALSDKTALSGQATWFPLLAPPPESNQILEERDMTSKSLSELVRDKVAIQHRITFSTFDAKKESVSDIRRSLSDSNKPANPPRQKPRPLTLGDEDSSDSVFSSSTLQSHLSNIKETEEERPPIQVRGSPRRRPRLNRDKPSAKGPEQQEYRRVCSNSSNEVASAAPIAKPQLKNYRRVARANSEDFTASTKHRKLPKTPNKAKKDVAMTLPHKRMTSPLLAAQNSSQTKVILTAPSSEECGYSSNENPPHKATLPRPPPEGRLSTGGEICSQLGPGQLPVVLANTDPTPGALILTLGIDKNMLTLEVVQAYSLPLRLSGSPPDTYVKTYILLDQNRSHKEKTTTVRSNVNPVFNERITYILNPNNKILQAMVWDEVGALRRNVFLGEVMIDLGHILTKGPLQGRYKLFPSPKPP